MFLPIHVLSFNVPSTVLHQDAAREKETCPFLPCIRWQSRDQPYRCNHTDTS